MKIRLFVTVLTCAAWLPSLSQGQAFCYYWVDNNGAVTSYSSPPVDLSYSKLDYSNGRLLIGQSDFCKDGEVVVKGPTEQAASSTEPEAPTQTAAAPEPASRPRPDIATPAPPTEVNLNPTEVNLRPEDASATPAEVNLRPRAEETVQE